MIAQEQEKTSFIFGEGAQANGTNAVAIGTLVRADGERSFAQGFETSAGGRFSNARGFKSRANGRASLASGFRALAQGDTAQALGYGTEANNDYSLAMGYRSKSSGLAAIAIGSGTQADAHESFAIGNRAKTDLTATNSVAIGNFVQSSAPGAFTMGSGLSDREQLSNDIANSLAIGFNSDRATLFVGTSNGSSTTGNVAIGHSDPRAKLDVAGDTIVSGSLSARILKLAELTAGKLLTTNEEGEIVTLDKEELGFLSLDESNNLNLNQDANISSSNSLNLQSERVNIQGLLSLAQLENAPENPKAGDIYYDASGALCIYLEMKEYSFENSYWEKITGLNDAYCNDESYLD